MNQSLARFNFKPAIEPQRALIHAWLQQDYVSQWIHGQGLQNTLNGLERFFQYQAAGRDLGRECEITQHWIGYEGDTPFVYLLTSNIFENEESEYVKYRQSDGPAITVDIFMGDAHYLGKGLASQVIREFLSAQFSDVVEVFIDPEQSNVRAIHVYQKTGFRIVGEFLAPWHPVPHYLMRLGKSD